MRRPDAHFLSALLVALAAAFTACSHRRSALPDVVGATIAFSPDERTVVVTTAGQGASASARDLEKGAVLWTRPVGAECGVSFSPGGSLVALSEAPAAREARVTVLDVRTGTERAGLGLPVSGGTDARFYTERADRAIAVSEDGRWLAVALADRGISIRALPAGEAVVEMNGAAAEEVAFAPDSRRIAAYGLDRRLRILDLSDQAWTERATLTDAGWPTWVRGGAAFVSREGIGLYDGSDRRLLVPLLDHVDDAGRADETPSSFLSADGRFALVQTVEELRVLNLATGEILFRRAVEQGGPRPVVAAGFTGSRLRAFLATGHLLDVDLAAAGGPKVKERSFGRPGRTQKSFAHEGATVKVAYVPILSPGGRWLCIWRRGKSSEFHDLD